MSNILPLFPQSNPIGHFVRIGHTGHRLLESLYTANRVNIGHAIFDANHVKRQKDLRHTLHDGGTEIILDTKSAELAYEAGLNSSIKELPWADSDRKHRVGDWEGSNSLRRAEQIAEFAFKTGVDAVLSPSHEIKDVDSVWLSADIQMVRLLRDALDRFGAKHIRIDYHLTLPVSLLRNQNEVLSIVDKIADNPIGNLWFRVSNFGMNASVTAIKRLIDLAWKLQNYHMPIIVDNVGGLTGISLAAFGAVGGICHGVAEKENFNISTWRKVQSNNGGTKRRIYFPQLDLYLQQDKAEIFLKGRGMKSLAVCNDPKCCHGIDEMMKNSKAHALNQSCRQIEKLNNQPELKRVDYLLNDELQNTGRTLRKAIRIKLEDGSITNKLQERSNRADLMHSMLSGLYASSELIPIAKAPENKIRLMKKAG